MSNAKTPGLWRVWLWPVGVVTTVVLTLLWIVLPGDGGAGWLWLPLAFAIGVGFSWLTWMPGRRILDG